MLPSTAKEARISGATRYFTGKPCRNGHVGERATASRGCIQCLYEAGRAFRDRDPVSYAKKCNASKRRRWDKVIAYSRSRYVSNKEDMILASEKWRLANREKEAERTARRKAAKLKACPPWVDHNEISKFYEAAREATILTGIPHEVDHIHPLQGETLCGLHVPWNLQILTKSENSRKKNRMIDAALK